MSQQSTRCRSAITRNAWTTRFCTTSGCTRRRLVSTGGAISSPASPPGGEVTIGVVGKYTGLLDAYKSLAEALTHGGIANNVRVNVEWIDLVAFENGAPAPPLLEQVHGILVPGGFGERGAEGKIAAARFARERSVPYFGICFGMQMAVVEAARNLAGIPGAGSTEFGMRRAGSRHDDRVDARQSPGAARGRWRSRRHHAARRLRMR